MNAAADPYRTGLGAYVLGALDGPERAELEEHLSGCPECREELVVLAGLPGLLRGLTAEEVAATGTEAAPSTEGLAERALAGLQRDQAAMRAARQRRRRAAATGLLAAAALAGVLVTGGLRGWWAPGTTISATDPGTRVHASVRMVDSEAGTRFSLRLDGVPEEQPCRLVAVGRDGTREDTASWTASYDGDAEVETSTWMREAQMAAVEIVTPEGRTLVRVPTT